MIIYKIHEITIHEVTMFKTFNTILKISSIMMIIMLLNTNITLSYSDESSILENEMSAYELSPDSIAAEAAILIAADSGQILFQKNMDKQMFPASITKLMTAILVLEDLNLSDTVVIDAESPLSEGSKIAIKENEEFTVEQLLNAMLIASANDAATALAKFHSGSIEEFSKKMNQRAVELGAKNTNFNNPHGLPDETHVTTAYDMAKIAQHAITLPQLLAITSTVSYEIPATSLTLEPRNINTSNKFLYGVGEKCKIDYKGERIDIKYEPIKGLKTGYTTVAKHTYVGYAKKNNMELISVILKSTKERCYADTRTLMDYGFDNLKKINLVHKGETLDTITLNDNKHTQIKAVAKENLNVYLPNEIIDGSWTQNIEVIPNLSLPLPIDGKLGTASYSIGNKVIGSTDLVTMTSVSDKALLDDTVIRPDKKKNGLFNMIYEYTFWLKIFITFFIWRTIMTMIRLSQDKKRKG